MGHAALTQLGGHVLEHPEERPELQDLGLAGPRLVSRRPDRDLDHVLVHVDPRDALVHNFHARPPPAAATPTGWEQARRPPEPRSVQEKAEPAGTVSPRRARSAAVCP